MVKNSILMLSLVAVLAFMFTTEATTHTYTDDQIFAAAKKMSVDNGWLPLESSRQEPRLDPRGEVSREVECWWLYGRPKTDSQLAEVVCELQVTIKGEYYSDFYQWYWVLTSGSAPRLPKLLEQIRVSPDLKSFREVVLEESDQVRSMTFIASREKGVIFPTPEQFKP